MAHAHHIVMGSTTGRTCIKTGAWRVRRAYLSPRVGVFWTLVFVASLQCIPHLSLATESINRATGNLYLSEVDYSGVGSAPLTLTRHYNSAGSDTSSYGVSNWRGTYDRSIVRDGISLVVWREDGKGITFTFNGSSWTPDADVSDRLVEIGTGGVTTGWTYTTSGDTQESYDANGRLTSITDRSGLTQTLTYSNGQLQSVSDAFGRTLNLTYDASGRVETLTDPAGRAYAYAYDAAGNLASVTYPTDTGTVSRAYHYNEATHINGGNTCTDLPDGLPHALTGITDEKGVRYATYDYDCEGRAVASEHAGSADKMSLAFNVDGTTTVTDFKDSGSVPNNSRTYGFQAIHGVIKTASISQPCSSCGGSSSTTLYDGNGNVASRADFNGNLISYTYDLSRNLELTRTEGLSSAGAVKPESRRTTTTWHATFRVPATVTVAKRNAGNTAWVDVKQTSFTYDTAGRVLTRTEIALDVTPNVSRTWTYTWNTSGPLTGLLATVNGPRTDVTDVTTYTYHTDTTGTHRVGDLWKVTNALNHVTTITEYDANGRPLSITDPNGLITTLAYHPRGWLASQAVNDGATTTTTSYTYDDVGQLTRVTLPDGTYLDYTYDAAHRLTEIQDNLGNRIHYTLDLMGNRTRDDIYDPSSTLRYTHSRVYNALNRLAQDLGATNQTTSFAYDSKGNLTTVTDPLARVTTNTYDALDRLVQVTNPNNGNTIYAYDVNDIPTSVTDPGGKVTTYSTNGLGDILTEVSPDRGTTTYTYDSGGNVKTVKDARNQTTTYAYDALNRVATATYGDATVTTYTYDTGTNGIGRLKSITDPSSVITTYVYNKRGQVTAKTQSASGQARNIGYAYDSMGRITQIGYPSGRIINYTYVGGQMSSVAVGTTTLVSGITHAPFGPVTGWTWGSGAAHPRAVDTDYRYSNLKVGTGSETLTYDNAGNLASITHATVNNFNRTYGYDNLDRVTSEGGTGYTKNWTWDANGNRLTAKFNSTNYNYTYVSGKNRINTVSGPTARTYTYDAAGNIATNGASSTIGRTAYTYNARGRLVTTATRTSSTATASVTHYYNALGQRVRKTGADGTVNFIYDEAGHLVGEFNGSNALIQETAWLGDTPIALLTGTSTIQYIHADHLNTPRVITNTAGTMLWWWNADAFGDYTANEDVDGNGQLVKYNPRFPGQYYDVTAKSNYNYFRDYDPMTGRYLQSDPIGLAGGLNTYAYVGGNPLIYTDSLGLWAWAWGELVPQPVSNFSAGMADNLSAGLTDLIREKMGTNEAIDKCSWAYGAGEWTGAGVAAATGIAGGIRAAGTRGPGLEFSHWYPNRKGGPRAIWNGNYVTPARHYYHDPFRYPRGWRDLGPKWPAWQQQFDRIPNVIKGGIAGAGWGVVGMVANDDCTCPR